MALLTRTSLRINRYFLWPIFHFSRWRRPPSWICFTRWDHPRRVFGRLCDCANFGCNRCSNFDSMQILIFRTLILKMPIHAPKIGVLWDFPPKMGSNMNETHKRHILGWKHVVWRIDRQNRSTGAGLGASRRIKQKMKNQKGIPKKPQHVFFTCSPRPPTLSQRQMDLHMWAYPRPGYIFKVSTKSVQGLRSPRGVKICPFPLIWLLAFTTACTTVQSVIKSVVRQQVN